MVGLFQRFKSKDSAETANYSDEFEKEFDNASNAGSSEIKPQHILLAGAGLEILRDLKDKMEKLEQKLNQLEKTIDERVPGKVLTEAAFKQEIQDGDEFANKIISEVKSGIAEVRSEVKSIAQNKSLAEMFRGKIEVEKPTLVETKRMEGITQLLQQHGKLSSVQLAQLMNMSRTRSNEYFKQMENLGIVDSEILGKEKYYKLKMDGQFTQPTQPGM